ncbi:family 16 glycoside hydrolase [Fuerstiella marisgermanici]|uniref:3-keto-alpha-glucoside-1,2-lyase/3-keto-2-hydroxy-glucal hydratase domain-containing protein n=1 Tax=Fuerstiella marisgermanici TaxID=1891926 RepID=A0A1P8WNE5_9PLAN|nr:family 16 glycoside hydrolase [Fuerstiella marisgermanici]APZ95568.1 hypothetical protein Fuma_05227 [Fuerstiella marisgermanici]
MKFTRLVTSVFTAGVLLLATSTAVKADKPTGRILLQDDFERSEADPEKEDVGNGWGTNSRSRARGVKQVDLVDGAMHITRAEVADHGVSVTHEVAFKDATINLRFKLPTKKDDLGINIADMKEKSVHAGHICMARIRPGSVEILDLKTGNMKLEHRTARQAGTVSPEVQKLINGKKKKFQSKIATDEWHDLSVQIKGATMSVSIDGKLVGEFTSEGIGHATKSRLRLAVNKSAWVDDVKITSGD